MRITLGIIGILAGIALGIYVGIYICLVGGITGLITVVTTATAGGGISASLIAWSVVKIMFAGAAGLISAYALILPSFAMLGSSNVKRYKRR